MNIYKEVIELGSYKGEDFIKREFFIDLDENQENKEEHVVILHRLTGQKEKITVQVTYFEPKKINRLIKYAKTTKEILEIRISFLCLAHISHNLLISPPSALLKSNYQMNKGHMDSTGSLAI